MLNETLIATRVLEQLGATEDEFPRIVSQIPTAIDRLGERIAEGEMPEWIDALRREFTVTAVSGEVDISTLFTRDQGLISTALHLAKVYQGTSMRESEWLPDRQAVEIMARDGFPVVAREGVKLIFGDSSGGVGTLGDTVKIRGIAIPYTSSGVDVLPPIESVFLDELAGIVKNDQS